MTHGFNHVQSEDSKDEWLTPPHIIASLGFFDLDPCAPINPPWRTAVMQYDIRHDGLKQPWWGKVLLTLTDDGKILPCQRKCHCQQERSVLSAVGSTHSMPSILISAEIGRWASTQDAEDVLPSVIPNAKRDIAQESETDAKTESREQTVVNNAPSVNNSKLPIPQISQDTRNVETVYLHGADRACEKGLNSLDADSEKPATGLKEYELKKIDMQKHQKVLRANGKAHSSIIIREEVESSPSLTNGAHPYGLKLLSRSIINASIATQEVNFIKTITSHCPILTVEELSSETLFPRVHAAIYQKVGNTHLSGLKRFLVSTGLMKPCGCFVGEYRLRVYCNPPVWQQDVRLDAPVRGTR